MTFPKRKRLIQIKMKKKRVNLNPSSASDLLFAKMGMKERAKNMASGDMPDDWDFNNISNEFKRFDTKYPGYLTRFASSMQRDIEMSDIDKHAILIKDSEFRRAYSLPPDLFRWMELSYPTIAFGTNTKHVQWFVRKFPMFSFEYYAKKVKT